MAPWSLIESRRRIVREFRVLASDVTSCRAAFRARYEKRIADTLATLQELDCLDPVDARHISLAINDAARCYYSVHWWFLFEAAIKNRCRIQASIGVVAAVVVLVWFAIMPKPEFSHVTINTVFWAFLTVALLSFVAYLLHSLVPYRYKIIVFIVEAVAALVAVAEFQSWSPHAAIIWKTLASSLSFIDAQHKKQFAAAPVADMLQLALWIMAMISGAKATWRIISFQAKASISRLQYGYGRPAEQCAELIIGFLNISRYISELLDRMEATIARPQNYLWLDASGLPSIFARKSVTRRLEGLAQQVRKPWKQAMRSHNGSVGFWIASQAPRIEFFIRHQRSKNMLAGNNLVELRNVMARALVQAADGDWHLIGSEAESFQAMLARRWRRIIGRGIAIILPTLGAIAALRLSRHLPAAYVQVIVVTCLGFAGVQLLGLIDPDSPARLDIAGRVAIGSSQWRTLRLRKSAVLKPERLG